MCRKTPPFRAGDIRHNIFYKFCIALVLHFWYNDSMKCKNNRNVVYSCKYHVVWCPKYRRKVLIGEIEKGISSHALRAEFPSLKSRLPTLWTNSYFVSTVGGAPLEAVKKYVENQKNV